MAHDLRVFALIGGAVAAPLLIGHFTRPPAPTTLPSTPGAAGAGFVASDEWRAAFVHATMGSVLGVPAPAHPVALTNVYVAQRDGLVASRGKLAGTGTLVTAAQPLLTVLDQLAWLDFWGAVYRAGAPEDRGLARGGFPLTTGGCGIGNGTAPCDERAISSAEDGEDPSEDLNDLGDAVIGLLKHRAKLHDYADAGGGDDTASVHAPLLLLTLQTSQWCKRVALEMDSVGIHWIAPDLGDELGNALAHPSLGWVKEPLKDLASGIGDFAADLAGSLAFSTPVLLVGLGVLWWKFA